MESILWLFPRPKDPQWQEMHETYAKDLLKGCVLRLLDKTFLLWHIGLGASCLPWAGAAGTCGRACRCSSGASFLRLVYVLHITWLVNSASHMWGYRNYETKDDSRNLWWVGLLAFGEGWHNNHHAFRPLPGTGTAGGSSTLPIWRSASWKSSAWRGK